jgi:hypothetical protein
MKDFNNCKMYKLIVEGYDLIYIGHTCDELCKRLYGHKNNRQGSRILFDMGIVKIILIEKFPCLDMDEARKREQELIDEHKDICVNLHRAYNSDEYNNEYYKEYQENNKDKIKERGRQWRENNSEHSKQWRENNKDKKKEYDERNKDKMKGWREKNKDKMKEYSRQWRENNKDKTKEYDGRNKDRIKEHRLFYKATKNLKPLFHDC